MPDAVEDYSSNCHLAQKRLAACFAVNCPGQQFPFVFDTVSRWTPEAGGRSGTVSFWPTKIRLPVRPLAFMMASTLVPYCRASKYRVSPF